MNCKNCGNEIKENENFCPKCGTRMSAEHPSVAGIGRQRGFKQPPKKLLILISCCVSLVILIVIIAVVSSNNNNLEKQIIGDWRVAYYIEDDECFFYDTPHGYPEQMSFYENSTFSLDDGYDSGTYYIDDDVITMDIKYDDTVVFEYSIKSKQLTLHWVGSSDYGDVVYEKY